VGQAQYWLHYGCALAQLGGRHEDAVRALRTAERINPTKVLRNRLVRDTLAVLLRHSRRRGSPVDQELRGMARRAGRLHSPPLGVASCSTECGSLFRFVSFRPARSWR